MSKKQERSKMRIFCLVHGGAWHRAWKLGNCLSEEQTDERFYARKDPQTKASREYELLCILPKMY